MVSSSALTDAYKIIPCYRLPRPAPGDTTSEGARVKGARANPTYRTSHVPDADNALNVRSVTQQWIRSFERSNGRREFYSFENLFCKRGFFREKF